MTEAQTMTATEVRERWQSVLRQARRADKKQLRKLIAEGKNSNVLLWCVCAVPSLKKAQHDLYVYGQSQHVWTDFDVRWAWRYYRRLKGERL